MNFKIRENAVLKQRFDKLKKLKITTYRPDFSWLRLS